MDHNCSGAECNYTECESRAMADALGLNYVHKQKAYISEEAYGTRVYVPYKECTSCLMYSLDRASKGGNYDQDTGACYSWTLFDDKIEAVRQVLSNHGFTIEECSQKNMCEVWMEY